MNQEPTPSKLKAYIQTAGLLLILLVLPLGSWYYLSSGLNYQRAARGELKDYGMIPAFHFSDQENEIVTADSLRGKMILASFFQPDSPTTKVRFQTLQALHEQFDDRDRIWFVQHLLPQASDAPFVAESFMEQVDFKDRGQIYFLQGSAEETLQLLRQGYKMPKAGLPKNEDGLIEFSNDFPQPLTDYPYFILIDDKGKIRNYYDSREKGEMKRLVEHMALVMPR